MRRLSLMQKFRKSRLPAWIAIWALALNLAGPAAAGVLARHSSAAADFFTSVICSSTGLKRITPDGRVVPLTPQDQNRAPRAPAVCLACVTGHGPLVGDVPVPLTVTVSLTAGTVIQPVLRSDLAISAPPCRHTRVRAPPA